MRGCWGITRNSPLACLACIQVEQDTFGLGNGDGHDVTATDDKENIKKRVSVEFEGQLRRLVSRVVKIRRFVQGTDEADWLRVWNVAYGTCLDLAPMTVEEITAISKSPDFDSEGRFIVELDDQPVGIVHAYVDKFMEEKKGFVRDFGVVPEFLGRGIEKN